MRLEISGSEYRRMHLIDNFEGNGKSLSSFISLDVEGLSKIAISGSGWRYQDPSIVVYFCLIPLKEIGNRYLHLHVSNMGVYRKFRHLVGVGDSNNWNKARASFYLGFQHLVNSAKNLMLNTTGIHQVAAITATTLWPKENNCMINIFF